MRDLFPWISKKVENRSASEQFDANGGSNTAAWHITGGDGSDSHIDERLALSLPAVYTSVSYIGDKVSGFPVDVFLRGADGIGKPKTLPAWLKQPNTTMTSFDFWNIACVSLLLHGNSFNLISRNAKGQVVELIPVHPERVSIKTDLLGTETFYTVNGKPYKQGVDILHIKMMSIANYAWGLSPITQQRRTILMGVNAEQFGADFYKYGLNLSGVIEMPKETKVSDEEAERLRKQFQAKHSGTTGSSAVGVLTGGAQWKPITINPADAQFLETRKYTAVQIAGIFHVPAYIVDPSVTSTWGTGIAEQNQMLVDAALEPLATRIEQAVSTFLLPGNQYMKFNMGELLKGDLETRTKVINQQIQGGLITQDEGRAMLNMSIVGEDKLQLPMNIQSVEYTKAKADKELELLQLEIELRKQQLQTGVNPGNLGGIH